MTIISDEAFAVMAVCENTKMPFGITVDLIGNRQYIFVWAFKIDREKAHREGYDSHSVTGSVCLDSEYPGCPYCGSKHFYVCACGNIVCYHGQKIVTCPECGESSELSTVNEISMKGGDY